MRTKTIAKPYEAFIEDIISFCDIADWKFQKPVLLISTRKTAPEIVKLLVRTGGPNCGMSGSLFISDTKSYSEAQLNELDLRGVKVVLIDDGSAVPPVEVLDKWAEKNDLNIIVRTDK